MRQPCRIIGLVAMLAAVLIGIGGWPPCGARALAADSNPDRSLVHFDDLPPAVQAPGSRAPAEALSKRAERAVERASKLQTEQRYTEAAIELERALRFEPDSVSIQRALALTLWQAGDSERARVYIDKVLKRGDDDIVCHYILARLSANQFENDLAILHFRKALLCTADPDNRRFVALARYHLAELLLAEGYTTAAIELYRALEKDPVVLDPADPGHRELAAIAAVVDDRIASGYESLGDWSRAVRYLEQSLAGTSPSPADRMRLARALSRAGQHEKAVRIVRALLAEDPQAADLLGEIDDAAGKPRQIIDDLRQAIADHPEQSSLVLALARALARFDQVDDASKLLTDYLEAHPDAHTVRWALFDLLAGGQRGGDAVRVAAALVHRRPEWSRRAVQRVLAVAGDVTVPAPGAVADDYAVAYLYAQVAHAQEHDDQALRLAQEAIANKADYAPARVLAATILLGREDWQGVLEVAAPQGVRLAADDQLEYCLGSAYAGLDRYEQAVKHLGAAIRLNGTNTAAMLKLAELYGQSEESALYLRELLEVVKVDPDNEVGIEKLFRAYLFEEDNRRLAAEQLDHLRRIGASPHRIARCVAWLEHDAAHPDWDRFRAGLQKAVDGHGPDSETLSLIAWSYLRQDHVAEGIEALKKALEVDPLNGAAAELLVQAYRTQLDFDDAIAWQKKLLDRFPNRSTFQQNMLSLLLIVQRYDEAVALAEQLADRADTPSRSAGYRQLAIRTYLATKDYDRAIGLLEKWYEQSPDNRNVHTWLIQALQTAGRHDQALERLRKWNKREPGGPAWAGSRVWARLLPSQRTEVEQMLLDGLLLDPDSDVKQLALIEFLLAARRFDDAVALARNNRSQARGDDLYDEVVLFALRRAGRYSEAIDLINRLILADTDESGRGSLALRLNLIDLMIRAGQFEAAAKRLNGWLAQSKSDEEKLTFLRLLANCHQENNKPNEAIEVLRLAQSMSPDDVNLNNDLGYTLADAGRDLKAAEAMIRKAVAGSPRTSAYLDSLGWVLYKRGKLHEALTWLLRARHAGDLDDDGVDLGEDPVICDHLGDVCWRLGDRSGAEKWWRESVRFAQRRIESTDQPADHKVLDAAQAKLAAIESGNKPAVAAIPEVDN